MKKKALSLLLAGLFVLSCCGCGSAFEAEYHYSEPFVDSVFPRNGNAVEIRNYNMLKTAIISLISNHEEKGELRFSNYNGSVLDDLAKACLEIKTENPLGAYAVETLSHDTSRIVSYYTASIHIEYRKTAAQIQSIIGVSGGAELQNVIREKISTYEKEIVTRIYSPQVDAMFVADTVREAYFSDPVSIVLEPAAEIVSYPAGGINHIYDISIQYGLNKVALQDMSARLSAAVEALTQQLAATDEAHLALDCANSVYYQLGGENAAYPSTAYGALVEHSADSKGMALAFQALCNAVDLECRVVQGSIGSMGTEEHYWNIIRLGEDYYHVDISQFVFDRSYAFLMSDEMLWGTYIWAAENYPACAGTMRYSDLIPTETVDDEASPEPESGEIPEQDAEKIENNT